jgi:hypothetical protein
MVVPGPGTRIDYGAFHRRRPGTQLSRVEAWLELTLVVRHAHRVHSNQGPLEYHGDRGRNPKGGHAGRRCLAAASDQLRILAEPNTGPSHSSPGNHDDVPHAILDGIIHGSQAVGESAPWGFVCSRAHICARLPEATTIRLPVETADRASGGVWAHFRWNHLYGERK